MKTRFALVLLSLVTACTSAGAPLTDGSSTPTTRGSVGVGVGGAQDIARFRSIVEDGEVPDPRTLDPIGFFAEHAMDLPPADCGASVCAHPMLAVAPRFDGSNWTTGFIGLNTAVDPATLARPPVHVAVVVDATVIERVDPTALIEGLRRFLAELRVEDRVSLVLAGASVEVRAEGVAPTSTEIAEAVLALPASAQPTVALYDGIATAAELVSGGELRHLLVLGTGAASAGITDEGRILGLVEALGTEGTSLTYVGLGETGYLDRLPLAIADLGTGAYYYAADRDDLIEVMSLEGRTALFPIARDFSLVVTAAPGYRIGRVTGAPRTVVTETTASIEAPVLLIGQREGALDVDRGRRGGGGGIFVELLAEAGSDVPRGRDAFTIELRYEDAIAGETVTLTDGVINALAPGETPALSDLPNFSDPARAKVFMMLNMYFALNAATSMYADGDCPRSLGVIDMMSETVEIWQASVYADPDTLADWNLMLDLRDNIQTACEVSGEPVTPTPPRTFGGGCFGD